MNRPKSIVSVKCLGDLAWMNFDAKDLMNEDTCRVFREVRVNQLQQSRLCQQLSYQIRRTSQDLGSPLGENP